MNDNMLSLEKRAVSLEIAVTTEHDAFAARAGGADSIEIAADLHVGGLTPERTLVARIRDVFDRPIHVMLRPHARGFRYSDAEIAALIAEGEVFRALGVEGVVFGAVDDEGDLAVETIAQVARALSPLTVTVHRALDGVADAPAALHRLIGIVPRVLTGGSSADAYASRFVLAGWVRDFSAHFEFVVSGGLLLSHLPEVVPLVRAQTYHFGRAARHEGKVSAALVATLRMTLENS